MKAASSPNSAHSTNANADRHEGPGPLDQPPDVKVIRTGIGTGTVDAFFKRGHLIAAALDAGRPVASGVRLTFERAEDLARFLTPRRLAFFRAVRERPGTIGDLSIRLTRSRESLTKDLRLLETAGLVTVTRAANPRQGPMDLIEPVSRGEILLEARF